MNCENCKYATWDYEEYYGGGRQYFVDGCQKHGEAEEACDDYEERKE